MENKFVSDESLLDKSRIANDDLYIFVFPNVFSKEKSIKNALNQSVSKEWCHQIYFSTFKIIESNREAVAVKERLLSQQSSNFDANNPKVSKEKLQYLREAWEGFEEENPKPEYYKFLIVLITNVIRVMQDELKLSLRLFFSQDKDEIFMVIKCSEENLAVQADLMDYKVQLKDEPPPLEEYKKVAPYGDFEQKSADGKEMNLDIYKVYDRSSKHISNPVPGEFKSFFTYKDKVRILLAMINSAIDTGELIENGIISSNFPVHDENLEDLKENWGSFKKFWKPQDLEKIRLYFGEKIGLYFAWLDYYVMWLILPAIVGLIVFIIQKYYGDIGDQEYKMSYSEISILVFSMVLALGSTLLHQLWLRRQTELSWMWGTTEMIEIEQQRPRFKGDYGKDPVSGQKKKLQVKGVMSFFKRGCGITISLTFVTITIALIATIFIYRRVVAKMYPTYGMLLCASINAFQIKIMNFIYRAVARKINDWENYEFDSEYNDSLALKLYLFQFINSYSSLFYIAFIKKWSEGCYNNNCLKELETQLGTIFIINMCLNLFELGLPYIKYKLRMRQEAKHLREMKDKGLDISIKRSPYEKESKLEPYETPLDDYMEIIIDYGYVVMFSSAFSIVPFLALIVNIFEIRVDSFKLCNLTKRPYPAPANSIGEWESIIKTVSVIGTLTNTGIIIFTTDIFDNDTTTQKWFYFMVIEHFLLFFKVILARIIPDVPENVEKGLIWSRRMVKEKIFGKPSDVDEQRHAFGLKFKGITGEQAVFDPEKIELAGRDFK
ncbi:hypothetical protein SteCoe_20704 [Stentor coeruleus]|uniref:Anoctamin transmembrane domain-containing protein n=1 Tax=Stentor coeruleus TaxID=5963 RepID=A0A1R2BRK5_9CILI|nr:hypothetical protein SteCoe_20704 [Stentor coeruleus]